MTGTPDTGSTLCQRCLQPIAARARRCPHCGDVQRNQVRRFTMLLGIAGLALALVLVALSLFLHGDVDPDTADDSAQPAAPAQPAKPPALDR